MSELDYSIKKGGHLSETHTQSMS